MIHPVIFYIEQVPNIYRTLENELPFFVLRVHPHLSVHIHTIVTCWLLADCWLSASNKQRGARRGELLFRSPGARPTHPIRGCCLLQLGLVEPSTMARTPYRDHRDSLAVLLDISSPNEKGKLFHKIERS